MFWKSSNAGYAPAADIDAPQSLLILRPNHAVHTLDFANLCNPLEVMNPDCCAEAGKSLPTDLTHISTPLAQNNDTRQEPFLLEAWIARQCSPWPEVCQPDYEDCEPDLDTGELRPALTLGAGLCCDSCRTASMVGQSIVHHVVTSARRQLAAMCLAISADGAYNTFCPGLVPDFLSITHTMGHVDSCISMGECALWWLTAVCPRYQTSKSLSGLLRLFRISNSSSASGTACCCHSKLVAQEGQKAGYAETGTLLQQRVCACKCDMASCFRNEL